eukprot:GHVR01188851.1.p1 GENE.GHVR01188851.1~~GHVR01188851.1.p1  ORF type:complete len:190 (+),score=11.71 GHVR01188851.1:980-1549(+)
MPFIPADMQSCKKKERCLFGPNEGIAYDPGNECESGETFDPSTCSCILSAPAECSCHSECETGEFCVDGECVPPCEEVTATIYWKESYETYSEDCSPETILCDADNGFLDPTFSKEVSYAYGTNIEFTTVSTGVIGTCSGTENTQPAIRVTKCVDGIPVSAIEAFEGGGCSVDFSRGAIVTLYDNYVIY